MNPTTIVTQSTNAFTLLEKSTTALLDAAFKLAEHKEYYDRESYLALLKGNGWKPNGTEEKRLLAIAGAFDFFKHSIHKLSKIEPKTIYQLAHEKMQPCIVRLQSIASSITQDLVVKIIRHHQNVLRSQKNDMERTDGWKYRKNGRIYRIEVSEEDDWTGMTIEHLRSTTGKSIKEIVRSGIESLLQQPGWEIGGGIDTASESDVENIQKDIETDISCVTLEPVQVEPGSIPTCFQPQVNSVEEKLFDELLAEFKLCQSWTCIRNVLYCCNSVTRSAAWNELNQSERQRVWSEMPEMVKLLAKAKKRGTIRDYREQLCGTKYEIYCHDDEAPIIVNVFRVERALIEIEKQ